MSSVRIRVLLSVVTFEAVVCCAARPENSSALATMSPMLVKKSGLKVSSATSSQSSPHAFPFHFCTAVSDAVQRARACRCFGREGGCARRSPVGTPHLRIRMNARNPRNL